MILGDISRGPRGRKYSDRLTTTTPPNHLIYSVDLITGSCQCLSSFIRFEEKWGQYEMRSRSTSTPRNHQNAGFQRRRIVERYSKDLVNHLKAVVCICFCKTSGCCRIRRCSSSRMNRALSSHLLFLRADRSRALSNDMDWTMEHRSIEDSREMSPAA